MIHYFYHLEELDFSKLSLVYMESLERDGMLLDPDFDSFEAYLQGRQDFYQYLREVFFRTKGAVYAVLEEKGDYLAALRLEPYRDGILLAAVETQPQFRRSGYAGQLVADVIRYCMENGISRIYSHVSKQNTPSQALHRVCGFTKISDHAAYIDGTVSNRAYTLCYQGETTL